MDFKAQLIKQKAFERVVRKAIEKGYKKAAIEMNGDAWAYRNEIILDHDFWKALFGYAEIGDWTCGQIPMWKHEMQQAVIVNPVKYLIENTKL